MTNKTFSEFVIIFGISSWLSIIALNNIIDIQTNIDNIRTMITMSLLKDANIGNGILFRALPPEYAKTIMYGVTIVQLGICVTLWRAVYNYILYFRAKEVLSSVKNRTLFALACFNALWIFFLCGGLWFGYWMKQGAIQNVHMTLLIIGIVSSIYISIPDNWGKI